MRSRGGYNNIVNTTGFLNTIKEGVLDTVVAETTHLAVGTDNTTPTVGDTTLGNEVLRKARQEFTRGTSDVIISLFLNSLEANGNSLKEVGMFDAASAGNLQERSIFTTITKTSSIEVWIDIEEQIDVTQ